MSKIIHLKEVESTQDAAFHELKNSELDELTVVADSQLKGRGRKGKVWSSPEIQGLYFTFSQKITTELDKLNGLSLFTGLVLVDLIMEELGTKLEKGQYEEISSRLKLKWPNDLIYLNEAASFEFKKLAGVLIETKPLSDDKFILLIGVGLNISGAFDIDDKTESFSLESIFGEKILRDFSKTSNLNMLIAQKLNLKLSIGIKEFLKKGFSHYKDSWLRCSELIGKDVLIEDLNQAQGKIIDLNDDGALKLKLLSGEEICYYGSSIQYKEV